MANVRKSVDGRKRARTMEYIDNDVDINEEVPSQSNNHIGQHIHAQFDVSMSIIDETNLNESIFERRTTSVIPKPVKKKNNERLSLPRQMSDISLNQFISTTAKTTTELRGRDHVLRAMKPINPKPIMEFKNHKLIQDMIAKRQEKQETNKPISDFALNYGLIDNNGKISKSRKTSDFIIDMAQQLENLKPTLTKRQTVDTTSPLLRVVKLKSVCNQLLCYCQYINDREDIILFLDPNNEQSKNLAVNDEIRIAGQSRFNMNLSELGSVALGITDVRKESSTDHNDEDIPMEITHTYDFNCSCDKCTSNPDLTPSFDLRKTFPDNNNEHQQTMSSVENVYESFTLALMTKKIFDLYATIIIFESDNINNKYIFIVRDGIGNCLQIILNDIDGLHIEIQTQKYIFHKIEYLERIPSPKESNRWPYEDYTPPKKLFCFRSIDNQVSIL
ncbi:unnamed protein product [Adineta steineri]|uniref:Uncharacterized protein n=1 Tax=Adineta steineri TaxID=433720 RepID=A0A813N6S7_9BILA|nr:unnamed protein product [Adineta steineri]CAF1231471.1 unnamed protein product [Adineta steineri]CAF1411832.1 unnamed protein product [Adineta steineri]